MNGEAHKKQCCLVSFVQTGGSNPFLHSIAPEVTKTPSEVMCFPFLREAAHQDRELVPSIPLAVLSPGPSPLALEPEEKSKGDKYI